MIANDLDHCKYVIARRLLYSDSQESDSTDYLYKKKRKWKENNRFTH